MKTWKVIDYGDVPKNSVSVDAVCDCGTVAILPVVGVPIARIGRMGVVFDSGNHAMPKVIKCRSCGKVYELGASDVR